MADEEDVVLTSAAAIIAVVASIKRRQRCRLCWVRQLGRSVNFKVLASVMQSVHKVVFDKKFRRQCGQDLIMIWTMNSLDGGLCCYL